MNITFWKSRENMRRHLAILFWSAIAAVSLTRGFLTSLKPEQSQDLRTMMSWIDVWLRQGHSPYDLSLRANYPPNSIVFLSPLAVIPASWVPLFWSSLGIALAVVVVYLAFRLFNSDASKKAALLPAVMFLSWAAVRVGLGNGQFSLLILCLGLGAVLCAGKYPLLAGLMIGIALMKPHVGAAFFLWALFTKKFRVCGVAIAVIAFALLVFAVRINESPLRVTQDYLTVVRLQFGGPGFLVGVSELRPLFHALIPQFAIAEAIHLIVLLALLSLIGLFALNKRLFPVEARSALVLQLCCLWVLLAFFHLSYDLVLMLPIVMALQLRSLPSHLYLGRRCAKAALWIVQGALVLELPGLWLKASRHLAFSKYAQTLNFVSHVDRLVVLSMLLILMAGIWLALRPTSKESHENGNSEQLSLDHGFNLAKHNQLAVNP